MKRPGEGGTPGWQSGFTLVEVIVVLAVILLLSGIAVPLISGYVDDGRRDRAEAEIKVLSAALKSFYDDVGGYPTRDGQGRDNRLYTLLSGSETPHSNPFTRWHYFERWGRNQSRGDVMDNHLLENKPGGKTSGAYPTSGNNRWRGPYLAEGSPLDPWGRPYVCNVISTWYEHKKSYKRMYLLSAGPNGRIDTSYFSGVDYEIDGDDIGLVLFEKE